MNRRWLLLLLLLPLLAGYFLRPERLPPAPAGPDQRLLGGVKQLREAASPTETQKSLDEIRAALRQMRAGNAREWMLAQWAAGEDFATELDLKLDPAQNLSGWSSWRIFLLDMLFLVDPQAAAGISRDLLATSQSPDEWAVAMRNLARVGKENSLLRAKSLELLRRAEWQKNPSAGYLEAFDVIVHTRNTTVVPDLLANCDARDEKAVRHASYLTLDRLILAEPSKVLPELARTASAHPRSGLMLSNMIARADVRDPVQRRAVETYLLDPKRTVEELRGFASVFPNANIAVSHNLLTKVPTLHGQDITARDRASLEAVSAWLADTKFSAAHDALRMAGARLEGYLSPNQR